MQKQKAVFLSGVALTCAFLWNAVGSNISWGELAVLVALLLHPFLFLSVFVFPFLFMLFWLFPGLAAG